MQLKQSTECYKPNKLLIILVSIFLVKNPFATSTTTIKNLTFQQFDDQGKLLQSLTATNIQHDTQQKNLKLTQPSIVITQNNATKSNKPITIHAQQATALVDGSQATLEKKVIIQQDGKLTTEKITLYPKQKYATTNQPIHIQHPQGIVDATGLLARWEDQNIQLLNNIHAILTPKNQPPIHASSNRVNFQGKQSKISLIGQAKIAQNENIFQAPNIDYDLKKQKVITANLSNKKPQQTEIIINENNLK